MISDPVAVFVVLAAVVYAALRLEESYRPFRSLGSALVGILIALVLSNSGVLPGVSPTYDLLLGTGVNLAIALILLSVDIGSIRQAGGKMLIAFGLGILGAVTGSILGSMLFFQYVGPETWKLGGQLAGTYIGGGMNFAALAQAFGTSSSLFTAAVAVDVVVSTLWFASCLIVPMLFGGSRRTASAPESESPPSQSGESSLVYSLYSSGRPVRIADAAALVAIAMGAVWMSGQIAPYVPQVPRVLWLTSISIVAAQLPGVRALVGSGVWGNYILLLYLASNGAKSVIANIFEIGPAVFLFAAFTVTTHGIVMFGVGRLLKLDIATLVVASQACVGGPASALAIATARGYRDCVLPGVAMGLLGYAVGNYVGFIVGTLLRGWLPA